MKKLASTTNRLLVTSAMFAAMFAFAAGCGWVSKVQECSQAIETINKGSPVIKNFDPSKDLEGQAKLLEDFEKQIAAVPVTDEELKKLIADYRAMILDMAKLVRDFGDPGEYGSLEQRNLAMVKTEGELVDRINGHCSRN